MSRATNVAAVALATALAACPAKEQAPAAVAPDAAPAPAPASAPAPAPAIAPERAPSRPDLRWIEGRVLAHGKAVSGVQLTFQPFFLDGDPPQEWGGLPTPPAPTDAEGRFAFEAPRAAAVFVGAGNEKGTAARVLQPADPWSQVTLELREDGQLEVRVTGPKGERVPKAEVRVCQGVMEMQAAIRGLLALSANALGGDSAAAGPAMPPLGAAAGPQAPGVWLARKVYAGVWHVLVRAPGYQRAEVRTRVEPGARKVVEVALAAGARVEGRVSNARKAVLSIAPAVRAERALPKDPEELVYEVALQSAVALRGVEDPEEQVSSVSGGSFAFDGLAPGEYRLAVSSEGFLPYEGKVTAPVSGLRIALEPARPRQGAQ